MILRTFFLSISIFVLHLTVFCQESYLGIKGGFNVSKLNSENTSSITLNNHNAYNIAIVFASRLENLPIGFSLEPGYTQKGAKTDNDLIDYKFHYLNLPFLIDLYPVNKLKLSLGPEVSYLSKAQNEINDGTKVSILNIYDNRWELSGTIGLSYSLDFFLDLGLRYNRAFTRISDFDATIDRKDLYTEYFQVYLTFKILN